MTDTTARFAESPFRIGAVLSRTSSVLSRNLLIFFVVTVVANLPGTLLLKNATDAAAADPGRAGGMIFLGSFLTLVLSTLSQAVVLYGAFQDMRGRRVDLGESLKVGLSRLLAIIGLAILMSLGIGFGFVLLIIPGLILITMWFVATPACVVERLGPFRSMGRSSQLTKGHRWKILGLFLILAIGGAIVSGIVEAILGMFGVVLALIGGLIWNGIWGAFYAIAVVVTYHDLRVAKEGVDIEHIASVFE
jgi:uncharacterized membrane protein